VVLTVHELFFEIYFFVVHLSFELENVIVKDLLFLSDDLFGIFNVKLLDLKLMFECSKF
jgi:hypothetical protein